MTVSPGALGLTPGQTGTLTAEVRDVNGAQLSGRAVGWTSSDPGTAAVSEQGIVTAISVGSATVSATAEGKSGSAQVTVAQPAAAMVVVAPESLSLQPGEAGQFVAEARSPGGSAIPGKAFTWMSSNPLIATVSETGQVAALALGVTTISASVDGKIGDATLAVVPGPVAAVQVTPPATTLQVGENVQLMVSLSDAQGNPVTGRPVVWTSANPLVASVSAAGVVSALVPGGPVTLTATVDGQTAPALVTVVPVPVASVQVAPTVATTVVSGTVQLTATAKDGGGGVLTGRPVQWASADPAIATVNATGLVTGVAAGGPVAVAATIEGKTSGAAITVALVPVATVQVTPPAGPVGVGLTTQLTATTKDGFGNVVTGRPITWQSGNPSLAAVSAGGLVTGVAPGGPVTVTASAEGHTGSAAVTVVPGPVASVVVAPPSGSVGVGSTLALNAIARDIGGNVVTGRPVTWSTSNASVATVSPTGVVTGVVPGPVAISASVDGQLGSAVVTVMSAPAPALLFAETFENASFASRGWYDLLPNAVTSAEHIPASTRSLEAHFNQGATNTSPGIGMRHKFTPTESVYLSYWVKYSANWVGSGQNFHPHEFNFMTTENPNDYQGPAFTKLTTYVEQNYQGGLGGLRAVVSAQDGENIDQGQWNVDLSNTTENRAVSGCNGPAGSARDGTPSPDCYLNGSVRWNGKSWRTAQALFTNAPGAGYKNDWHKVEAYFKLNSIVNGKAQLDGIVRYWFDGQLVIDRTSVELRTGARPNMKFDKFLFSPYIGNGSPVAQSMWIDDLVVMDGKP